MSFSIRIGNHAHKRALFVTICIVMLVILGAITGMFDTSKTVHANVMGIGAEIYWDQDCTNRTLQFDFGSIEPGSNKTLALYIRNEGDSAAHLSIVASDWAPPVASSYMSLNWNYSGQILSVGQVIPLELTLAVSPNITGITDFSFDTTIATTN